MSEYQKFKMVVRRLCQSVVKCNNSRCWTLEVNVLRLLCAACPPRWLQFIDQVSIFGVRYDPADSVSSCQEYCASVPACLAIEFNFNDNSCWLHDNPRDLLEENTYWQENTNHYRINRTCVEGTTGTSTVRFTRRFLTNLFEIHDKIFK